MTDGVEKGRLRERRGSGDGLTPAKRGSLGWSLPVLLSVT